MRPFTVTYLHPTSEGWRLENHYIVAISYQRAIAQLAHKKQLKFKAQGTGQYRGSNGSVLYIELSGPTKPTLEDFHDLPPLPAPAPEPKTEPQPTQKAASKSVYKIVDVDYAAQTIAEYWLKAENVLEAAQLSPAIAKRHLSKSGATRFQTANGFVLIYENPPHTC